MKNILISLLMPWFLMEGCTTHQGKEAKGPPTVNEIEILKMTFNSFLVIDVKCGLLDEAIGSNASPLFISEKDRIVSILNSIEKSVPNEEDQKPDTRARLRVNYRDGHVDSLCVGKFWATFNGQSIILEDSLRDFLENLEVE